LENDQKINLEDMNSDQRFVFTMGLNLGFFFKARDSDKDTFMNYCEGIWDTIEMQENWEDLRDTISDYMNKNIPIQIEEWKKRQSS
jgi:hypothetical protein